MFKKRALALGFFLSSVVLAQNVEIHPTQTFTISSNYNWTQTPTSPSTLAAGSQVVTLSPCPRGLDMSGSTLHPFYVYTPTGTPESMPVTAGGTCTPGAASGTIMVTAETTHSAGYVIQSAYSGIQEGLNDAGAAQASNLRVVIAASGPNANAIPVYAPIYDQLQHSLLDGYGVLLSCQIPAPVGNSQSNPPPPRSSCLVLGDLTSSNDVNSVVVKGLRFTTPNTVDGCLITNTQRTLVSTNNTYTITTSGTCPSIVSGDNVVVRWTDNSAFWGVWQNVTNSSGTITWTTSGTNRAAITGATTPGSIEIENAMIEDNAVPATMEDIQVTTVGGGRFNNGIVVDNDQAATIRGFSTTEAALECTTNTCGSFVYSAGNTSATPVIWIDKSNISPQCGGNAVEVLANNTVRISDTVIQGFGMFGVMTTNTLGSYGGTQMDNVYMEEGSGGVGCSSPFISNGGNLFAAAGVIYGGNNEPLTIRGGEAPQGHTPQFVNSGTTGTTQYSYYVVVHDNGSGGGVSYPLYAGYATTNGTTGTISVLWPRVPPSVAGAAVKYDVVRMVADLGLDNNPGFPYTAFCTGGSASACGSVALLLSTACTGLVCSYSDSATASTSSYTVASANYFPFLPFWPGGLIAEAYASTQNPSNLQSVYLDSDNNQSYTSPFISVTGNTIPSIYVRHCLFGSYLAGAWEKCDVGDQHYNSATQVGATLYPNGPVSGSNATGVKGVLNFIQPPGNSINPQHILTLVDSNPGKTFATGLNRPPNDANDTWIGLDNSNVSVSNAQLAFGAPIAISDYIANTGNTGSGWKEQLTSSSKTFNVPLNLSSTVTTYDGLSTSGLGVPPIIGMPLNSTGNTANLAATTLYTTVASGAGAAGTYRICLTAYVTTTGTATAIVPNVLYNNGNSVTRALPTLSAASTSNVSDDCVTLYSAASQTIRVDTTGYSGTGTFAVRATIEQLQ